MKGGNTVQTQRENERTIVRGLTITSRVVQAGEITVTLPFVVFILFSEVQCAPPIRADLRLTIKYMM